MNAILFEIGPITIYWYTLMIFIAFLLGGTLAINEAKKWKIKEDFILFYLLSLLHIDQFVLLFNSHFYYWSKIILCII